MYKTEQSIRAFNFDSLTEELMKKENLSYKWHSSLYEQLFLEEGVKDIIKFQEHPNNLDSYDSPIKELVHGLQKYYNYQENELIVIMS